ncbi:GGDEF domain-containing protein [Actinotalea ferrariae]|uniref:GGDEF domain-containing protein n=1 Tax=Actinotalea ferrariae TaxID=1386098 RepID=UPI001C8B2A30|nr:GGDEF domain-containing protein [Actinotalea ferrariae]MBX9247031.1 GGDEF domain-containing protein [Actinotalea ferrariae]
MHPDRLGPRDLRSAALTAAALVVAGALAMLSSEVMAVVAGEAANLALVGVVAVLLAVLAGAVVRSYRAMPPVLWMALALAMVVVILVMNLVTEDAGGGAQMAYLFPVVYAGAFLRAWAACVVAATAAVSHGITVFALLEPDVALPDTIFALIVMLGLTAVLTTSGRRQDALTRQLRATASVDLLTGLATRRALESAAAGAAGPDDRGGSAADGARATVGRALVLVDVDQFKALNDAYGHPAGDAVLVHLGSVLQGVVRAEDTVARWGGDELAILMVGIGAEDARRRAEAVRAAAAARPLVLDGRPLPLTVSVGVVHSTCPGPDLEAMYAAADEALYQAKRGGRDRVVVAGPGTGSRTLVP